MTDRTHKVPVPSGSLCVHVLWTLVVAGLLSGCGYQFMAGGPGPVIGESEDAARIRAIQEKAPRLVVLNVKNNTFQPNIEGKYTEYLRREFSAGSGARVVGQSEAAELQLEGVIETVTIPSISFARSETFESRVTVTIHVRVRNRTTRQVVWTQRATRSSEFFVTQDLQQNRVLQDRAVEQAGQYVSADLADRFLGYLESTIDFEQKREPPPTPAKAEEAPTVSAIEPAATVPGTRVQ